jgi:N-acetyl-anhydromuramyl-L-alanine amidase AmpD
MGEQLNGAEKLQYYAAVTLKAEGRQASWHYAVDGDSITASVKPTDRAYAAGPGNDRSIHIELVGTAAQSRGQWADSFSSAMLDLTAKLVAMLCLRFGIPVRRIDATDLVNRPEYAGICGHSDWTAASTAARRGDHRRDPWWNPMRNAWRKTTHGDPGMGFPWESFIAAVKRNADHETQKVEPGYSWEASKRAVVEATKTEDPYEDL